MRHPKYNMVIAGMCLLLTVLIGRLFIAGDSRDNNTNNLLVFHESFYSSDELETFVFVENMSNGGIVSIQPTRVNEDADEPVANETPSYVSLYPDLYASPILEFSSPDDGKKKAFLTFDDGPSDNTCEVLEILQKENVKATFFVIGEMMNEQGEECLKQMVEDGHIIGLHSYSHDYKKIYASVDSFLEDFEILYQMIYEIIGVKPNIYRFPGGSTYNKRIKNEIIAEMERRGFTHYDWNVSAEDSVGRPTEYSIMKNIRRDAFRFQCPVILMHDSKINSLTANLLSGIISEIREEGYEFDTLDNRKPCQF